MNIYITTTELRQSARNLDNNRLQRQIVYLAEMLRHGLELSSLKAVFSAHPFSIFTPVEGAIDVSIADFLPQAKISQHSSFEWISKPFNYWLMLAYYQHLINELRQRRLYIKPYCIQVLDWVCNRHALVQRILELPYAYSLEWFDLYRNVKPEYTQHEQTVEAYRRQLIDLWKEDLEKAYQYSLKMEAWANNPATPRPRKPYILAWGTGSLIHTNYPKFAKLELIKHIGEINARRTNAD